MAEDVVIRTFQEDDASEVRRLWHTVFHDDPAWNEPAAIIRRKVAVQPNLFCVGTLHGRVVATVMAGYDGHRGWIYHLAVAPEHRRQGLGREMMREAEIRLRALDCPKINLQIRGSNVEAVRFYRALGYGIEDRISMGKRLE